MARTENATFFVFTFVSRLLVTLFIIIVLTCISQDRDVATQMDSPLMLELLAVETPPNPSMPFATSPAVANSTADTTTAAAQSLPRATARMNEDLMVDLIQWRAVGVEELGNFLKSNREFQADATTPGKFVRVTMEVKNCKKQPAIYTPPAGCTGTALSHI